MRGFKNINNVIIDKRYHEFFKLFEERDYFECHEVLEEIWIEETNCTTKNHPAIPLLQFSVALLHWKRENYSGAFKVFQNSFVHLKGSETDLNRLGVDSTRLKEMIKELMLEVENRSTYRFIQIPLLIIEI